MTALNQTLPFGIASAFAVNLFVGLYFVMLYRFQDKDKAYLNWAISCSLFLLGTIATVISHSLWQNPVISVAGCLSLFFASYFLFLGLHHFELTLSRARMTRQTRFLAIAGIVIIPPSAIITGLESAVASVLIAIMFLITEGCFYRKSATYKYPYLLLRSILLLHAFTMLFQGGVLTVGLLTQTSNDTHQLFLLTLFTHLMLTVATALILPVLQLFRQKRHWQKLASIDELTGVYSRRQFIEETYKTLSKSDISEHCLLIIDIDHFKQINDGYGHLNGDEVLKQVAQIIKHNIRGNDLLGRLGGEEFAVFMKDIGPNHAHVVANRLLESVAHSPFHVNGHDIAVTISAGIASTSEMIKTWETLFEKADEALYSAKRNGRNLVYLYAAAPEG